MMTTGASADTPPNVKAPTVVTSVAHPYRPPLRLQRWLERTMLRGTVHPVFEANGSHGTGVWQAAGQGVSAKDSAMHCMAIGSPAESRSLCVAPNQSASL